MRVELYELHPGDGEWGKTIVPKRGFSEGQSEIYRGVVNLPFVGEGQHIFFGPDDYVIKRVTHLAYSADEMAHVATPSDYRVLVHVTYNGQAKAA